MGKSKHRLDLSRYSHLNESTPMQEWLSEFLSRNCQFLDEWKKIPRFEMPGTPETKALCKRYGFYSAHTSPRTGRLEVLIKPFGAVRLLGSKVHESVSLPEGAEKTYFNTSYLMVPESSLQNLATILLHDIMPEDLSMSTNLLLLCIDLSRSRKDIDAQLKTYLDHQKPHDTPRHAHTGKWRIGLMAYDLRHSNDPGKPPSFGEIAIELSKAGLQLTTKNEGFDYRNARDIYQNCRALIEGGYRKYL